jgi:hypothetical protein
MSTSCGTANTVCSNPPPTTIETTGQTVFYNITVLEDGEHANISGYNSFFNYYGPTPTDSWITYSLGTNTISGSDINVPSYTIYINCIFEGENGITNFNISNASTVFFMGCDFTTITNFIGNANIYFIGDYSTVVGGVYLAFEINNGYYNSLSSVQITDFRPITITANEETSPAMYFTNISESQAAIIFGVPFVINSALDVTEFDAYFDGKVSGYTINTTNFQLLTPFGTNRSIRGNVSVNRNNMNIHKNPSIKDCRIKLNGPVKLVD